MNGTGPAPLKPARLTTLSLLALVGLVVVTLSSCSLFGGGSQKPNVVLVIIDTLRADKLGLYGFPRDTSSGLDLLGREGAWFRTVVAQASWTRPSIATMLTSRAPSSHGIRKEQWDILGDSFTTLAEVLQGAGYGTYGVTANPNINSTFHFHQGFDEYIDSAQTFRWLQNKEPEKDVGARKRTFAGDVYERALSMARTKGTSKPGYLQINIMDVHSWSRWKPAQIDADLRDDPEARYLQAVRVASRETAKFLAALRQIPGWEDTLAVITSDHGEGLGDHPSVKNSQRHGNLLYESHIRVPLIFNRPADPKLAGHEIAQPLRLLDLVPTVLEYLGLTPTPEMEGVSVASLLRDPHAVVVLPDQFYAETKWRGVDKASVYGNGWQYIENRDSWEGVPPQELQSLGGEQDGHRTHQGEKHREVLQNYRDHLKQVEERLILQAHQAEQAQPGSGEVEELKSLGYLN